jgi:PEP-CTERM motif-containing protein
MTTWKHLCLAGGIFLLGASVALAGPGKSKDLGASNNGVGLSFAACDVPGTENCGQYSATPFETVDGASVYKFVTNDGSNTAAGVNVYDVFQIPGSIGTTSLFTLNLNNINHAFGDFACDNSTDPSSGTAIDSLGNSLTGPCTAGLTSSLAAFLSETDSGNSAAFTFSGGPSSWTFYTADGNLASFALTTNTTGGGGGTSTPEPGSLTLLMAGLATLGFVATKARR